ncbi:MAG: type II secretion system GspH family protein [Desulfotignum sp.]|nr:type II secretion system GspH family protein [Desulfotignum sp.]
MKQYHESGFTIVEIISVLVILGILSTVALVDFFNLQERIRLKMVDNVISDLNNRESLFWATQTESQADHDDSIIFNLVDPWNIGVRFTWSSGPEASGTSTITLGPTVVDVKRTPSTTGEAGFWERLDNAASDQDGDDSDGDSSPGQSGSAPGQGGNAPGKSEDAPGKNKG